MSYDDDDREYALVIEEFIKDPKSVIQRQFLAHGIDSETKEPLEDGSWGLVDMLERCVLLVNGSSSTKEDNSNTLSTTTTTTNSNSNNKLPIKEINNASRAGIDGIEPGRLSRFRCIVQDMRDPEYYVGCYRTKRDHAWKTTKYCEHGGDEMSREDDDSEDDDDDQSQFGNFYATNATSRVRMWERKVFYCVPIPGEARWVCDRDFIRDVDIGRDDDDVMNGTAVDFTSISAQARSSSKLGSKRTREEEKEEETKRGGKKTQEEPQKSDDTIAAIPNGSQKTEDFTAMNKNRGGKKIARETLDEARNLPLPNDHRGPCIVCVYDNDASTDSEVNKKDANVGNVSTAEGTKTKISSSSLDLKLNDVVEFYGILSLNPENAAEAFGNIELNETIEEEDDGTTNAATINDIFGDAERSALYPASSIAPRFHALGFIKLKLEDLVLKTPSARFINDDCSFEGDDDNNKASSKSTSPFNEVRTNELYEKLIDIFTEALGGDKVAASYALFLACSRIRLRTDELPIGSLSVNFSKESKRALSSANKAVENQKNDDDDDVANTLAYALQTLCPATACLTVDVPSLNARSWIPKKDYERNRLRSGPLQLAEGTVCVLDETKLQSGILAETGVKNARALKEIIQTQRATYDFDFHQMSVPTDISFAAISEGKSILFSEMDGLEIPLRFTKNACSNALLQSMDNRTLDDMRTLIACIRTQHLEISETSGKSIEASMVQKRQEDAKEASQAKMHLWLTMARLQSLLKGRKDITADSWNEVLELERLIKERKRMV